MKKPKFCKKCGGKLIWNSEYYRGDFDMNTGKQCIKKIYICSKDKHKGYDKDWYNNPRLKLDSPLTFPEDHGVYHI